MKFILFYITIFLFSFINSTIVSEKITIIRDTNNIPKIQLNDKSIYDISNTNDINIDNGEYFASYKVNGNVIDLISYDKIENSARVLATEPTLIYPKYFKSKSYAASSRTWTLTYWIGNDDIEYWIYADDGTNKNAIRGKGTGTLSFTLGSLTYNCVIKKEAKSAFSVVNDINYGPGSFSNNSITTNYNNVFHADVSGMELMTWKHSFLVSDVYGNYVNSSDLDRDGDFFFEIQDTDCYINYYEDLRITDVLRKQVVGRIDISKNSKRLAISKTADGGFEISGAGMYPTYYTIGSMLVPKSLKANELYYYPILKLTSTDFVYIDFKGVIPSDLILTVKTDVGDLNIDLSNLIYSDNISYKLKQSVLNGATNIYSFLFNKAVIIQNIRPNYYNKPSNTNQLEAVEAYSNSATIKGGKLTINRDSGSNVYEFTNPFTVTIEGERYEITDSLTTRTIYYKCQNNANCDENAECSVLESGIVKCSCNDGYIGNGKECYKVESTVDCSNKADGYYCYPYDCGNKFYPCVNGEARGIFTYNFGHKCINGNAHNSSEYFLLYL